MGRSTKLLIRVLVALLLVAIIDAIGDPFLTSAATAPCTSTQKALGGSCSKRGDTASFSPRRDGIDGRLKRKVAQSEDRGVWEAGKSERDVVPNSFGRHLLSSDEVKLAWAQACRKGACIDLPAGAFNSWTRVPRSDTGKKSQAPTPADDDDPPSVVTISDVARFLPARGVLHAEPDGWAVVGVAANFWVDVSPMVAHAELLDEHAEVRFTPRLFEFSYGDGEKRTTASPGASWSDLGVPELSPTSTSHVFTARRDATAAATVTYSAEFRLDGGAWQDIAGAVTAEVPGVDMLVVAERTVLTAGATPRRP